MSNDDSNDRDDADERSRDESYAHGFRLEVGLRSLSDLLGDLLEADASDSRPPADPTHRLSK